MSLNQLSIKAPAKLNLRLKIVGRRADGYHLLSMLNTTISLCDELIITKTGSDIKLSIESDTSLDQIGKNTDNLVYRAASLFFDKFSCCHAGISIHLKKNIPIGAGLGGGSSDAASTLIGLAKLYEQELGSSSSSNELIRLGAQLGCDVPYFIKGGLCAVGGCGEEVLKFDVNPLRGKSFLLICPQEHSNTASVYKDFAKKVLTENLHRDTVLSNFEPSYSAISQIISNDLSQIVCDRSELCRKILNLLQTFPEAISAVTGSGSAMYSLPRLESDVLSLKKIQLALPSGVESKILTFY